MKSELFPGLEDIVFAEKSAEEIESEIITLYERLADRTLARGDPVRLFLETIILIIVQQRSLIDYAAKQNLLAYASGSYLDHLGALLEVTRLEASPAMTTLKFTLSQAQPSTVIIPAGVRVSPGGGNVLFATTSPAEIPAGDTEALITAQCTIPGSVGNGYVAGQLRRIVDPFPYELAVTNTTTTYGGSDTENDENYRERIQIAPESFSVAGPRGAYEYYARSAHQDIIDVAVIGPPDIAPGYVEIYPLMKGGELPSSEVLASVLEICNSDSVRPLTDCVSAHVPDTVSYSLNVKYYIDRAKATQSAEIQEAVSEAVTGWVTWQRSTLGRDLNPSELYHRMIAAGAKRTEITSPSFRVLKASELAIPSTISLTFG
ncbi:MAG: baseplate J/gp47 family protein, partial [Synergistaceae bacterium]|nr:baseplate J/gp47 family protein [Synergistaceae bacterium]